VTAAIAVVALKLPSECCKPSQLKQDSDTPTTQLWDAVPLTAIHGLLTFNPIALLLPYTGLG